MKAKIPRSPIGTAVLLALILAGSVTASAAILTNVNIVDNAFNPGAIAIQVNDRVKWSWVGGNPHSSTSDTGIWDSDVHGTGFSFTNLFSAAGSFPYHCTVHGFMTASISVT